MRMKKILMQKVLSEWLYSSYVCHSSSKICGALVVYQRYRSKRLCDPNKQVRIIWTSLSFLKIGSLVFSVFWHDDTWPWYLVTGKARFLKKKLECSLEQYLATSRDKISEKNLERGEGADVSQMSRNCAWN